MYGADHCFAELPPQVMDIKNNCPIRVDSDEYGVEQARPAEDPRGSCHEGGQQCCLPLVAPLTKRVSRSSRRPPAPDLSRQEPVGWFLRYGCPCTEPASQRLNQLVPTTQRKPMWVVELSWDCGDRAAGR